MHDKPKFIKKGKYWRYITTEDGRKRIGLFEWPSNKLLARYRMNSGPDKKRINPEINGTMYPNPKGYKNRKRKLTVGLQEL